MSFNFECQSTVPKYSLELQNVVAYLDDRDSVFPIVGF
jgi:hypothetical protein